MILKVNNIRLLMRIFIFQSMRNLECLISDNWHRLNFQYDRALLYLVSQNYQNRDTKEGITIHTPNYKDGLRIDNNGNVLEVLDNLKDKLEKKKLDAEKIWGP